jgi:hypothetical protein
MEIMNKMQMQMQIQSINELDDKDFGEMRVSLASKFEL